MTKAQKKAKRARQDNAIVRYFKETWVELKKVNWPTRREALNLTLIVLAVTAFMALLLGAIDLFFTWAFSLIL
ncbi:MAG: preprotein translocase subunit SecE [Anaerolineae bacterium]|jgi:preprotein translocase subunit SecE|nr:preprotein translocase subunit SecE [Anaerolineae bacterium]MDH7474310.1 preprotein translocase subunit SecE [Anaerolineae bacterium]